MKRSAFTLVEILIVVIILGILASIVVAQFGDTTNEARESQLTTDLKTLRTQVEVYRAQHLCYPSGDTFEAQLTRRTDKDGNVMPADGDEIDYPYGPYLQRFPTNPFVAGDAGDEVTCGPAAAPGNGASGWYFCTSSNTISPNDAAHKHL